MSLSLRLFGGGLALENVRQLLEVWQLSMTSMDWLGTMSSILPDDLPYSETPSFHFASLLLPFFSYIFINHHHHHYFASLLSFPFLLPHLLYSTDIY